MPNVLPGKGNPAVTIPKGSRLLEALIQSKTNVMMACGGQGICATCHVYVKRGAEGLSAQGNREKLTLGLITGATDRSRLSCQTIVEGDTEIELELPDGLYVSSLQEIEALIGKRTASPILHPVDGRVLIAKSKIITRSRILELANEDFSMSTISLQT